MRSIIEEFAYGNISPEVQTFKKNSEYGRAMRVVSEIEGKLLDRLSEEDRAIFERFVEAQGKINQLTAVKNLEYGYKLGVVMTAEVFVTSEDLIVGEE